MFFTAVLSVIFLKAGFLLATDFLHLRWLANMRGFVFEPMKTILSKL